MVEIISDLELKGWKILKHEGLDIFAKRKSTGKLAFFTEANGELDQTEIIRVWTKKGFHPFLYRILKGGIFYYDFLSDEFIKNP